MATLGAVEYADASPEVRDVYDDIMATRKTDSINNFWGCDRVLMSYIDAGRANPY
jgi:hypothetical protein